MRGIETVVVSVFQNREWGIAREPKIHLVSLEIRGLKSLRHTVVPELKSYNVFIGKNDSGKSTILQAIRLLETIEHELEHDYAMEIVTDKQARGRIQMGVVFELSDSELAQLPEIETWREEPVVDRLRHWRYDFEMRVGHDNWPKLQLYLTRCGPIQGEDYGRFFALGNSNAPESGYRFVRPESLKVVLTKPDQPIQAALNSVWKEAFSRQGAPILAGSRSSGEDFYIQFLRHFVDNMRHIDPTRRANDEMPVTEKDTLDPSGIDLTQVLETWRASDPTRFRIILGLLKGLFPDVKDLHLTREMESTVLRIASGRELQPRESFRLSQVGSGVQQAIMVAAAVVSAEKDAVVLLEEPENNLHAGAQRVLSRFLKRHSIETHKQVVITTHSTIFASTRQGASTYLVRLHPHDGTIIRRIEPGDEPATKQELGIRNVDLYGYDAVILWEGNSEAEAMPILLEAIATKEGTTIHELGLTWRNLRGSGKPKVDWVREFLGLLKDTDIIPYVIMDDDPGVKEELKRLEEQGLLPQGHYHVWQEGRSKFGRNPEVGSEFEDNFTNEQLVLTAMEMAKDEGIDMKLDVARFTKECENPEKKTSKVLKDYCWDEGKYDLSKPELNRRLAMLVSKELTEEAERTVEEYEFEKVVKNLFEKVRQTGRVRPGDSER